MRNIINKMTSNEFYNNNTESDYTPFNWYFIEKMGELKIVRTAGLDIIHLHNQYTFEECVKRYYASIK